MNNCMESGVITQNKREFNLFFENTWIVFLLTDIRLRHADESDIPTKTISVIPNKENGCFHHRQIKHKCVFVYITYYTFDADFMEFCRLKLGTILYKEVVPAMWSPFWDHIAENHIKHAIVYNKIVYQPIVQNLKKNLTLQIKMNLVLQ